MRVTAIVVHYRAEEELRTCLRALRQDAPSVEVVVVDNASLADPAGWPVEFPDVRWSFLTENRGFGAAVNEGASLATGELLLLLNPDARPLDDCVSRLVGFMDATPSAAAVGAQLLSPDGSSQPSGGRFPTLARLVSGKWRRVRRSPTAGPGRDAIETDWVSAAAMLCRRDAFAGVGGMDEGFFLYYEDCDLCLRLRHRGWRTYVLPSARAVHSGGASFRGDRNTQRAAFRRSEDRYFRKHRPAWERLALRALRPIYDRAGLRGRLYPEVRTS